MTPPPPCSLPARRMCAPGSLGIRRIRYGWLCPRPCSRYERPGSLLGRHTATTSRGWRGGMLPLPGVRSRCITGAGWTPWTSRGVAWSGIRPDRTQRKEDAMPYYMYVALQEDNKLSVLFIDPPTGTLTPTLSLHAA